MLVPDRLHLPVPEGFPYGSGQPAGLFDPFDDALAKSVHSMFLTREEGILARR